MAKSVTVTLCKETVPLHYYTSIPTKELHDLQEDHYQHFYSKLNYNQSLFRVILQRATQKVLRLEQWNRVDLCLVNEMGLPSCQDMEANIQVQLTCKILSRKHQTFIEDPLYQVGVRPLQDDAWSNNERSQQLLIGFNKSNQGGLEYLIRRRHNNSNLESRPTASFPREVYLYICQTSGTKSPATCNALPLVIGPLVINEKDTSGCSPATITQTPLPMWSAVVSKNLTQPPSTLKSVSNGFWDGKEETTKTCRAYPFLSSTKAYKEQYFLMEENWKLGMPGKIWDGALVITDIFAKHLTKNPSFLDNAHVLDLSAGLGCFGLTISSIYHNLRQQTPVGQLGASPLITLTDVQEALSLIKHNYHLNMPPQYLQQSEQRSQQDQPFVSIMPLRWGFQSDAQKIIASKPIDYLIASDVLYDASKASALAKTLYHLSTPGITTVYLVYKKRALKREEEQSFFNECRQFFDVSIMPASRDSSDNSQLCRDEASVDGSAWLGQGLVNSAKLNHIPVKQTGVVVYQLKRRQPVFGKKLSLD